MDIVIDGSVSEMEKKFHKSRKNNVTAIFLAGNDHVWGVQLKSNDSYSYRHEAQEKQRELEEQIKKQYWALFEDGVLLNYQIVADREVITDSHFCNVKTSIGDLLGRIYTFIMANDGKYQVCAIYVDEKNYKKYYDGQTPLFISNPTTQEEAVSVDIISIKEMMDIVAYRRHHPLDKEGDEDRFIRPILEKHQYKKGSIEGGIGTCAFWEYIKHGYSKSFSEDDDMFVPTNTNLASTVLVADCSGIETIDGDEISISVETRVYGEAAHDQLMKEMKDIGFRQIKKDEYGQKYQWKSYVIHLNEHISRGNHFWFFSMRLEPIDYASTKKNYYADSTATYHSEILVDYPIKGNEGLIKNVRGFIYNILKTNNFTDYVKKEIADATKFGHVTGSFSSTTIKKVAETDQFISFEYSLTMCYGGIVNRLNYGATFRKTDGKRIHIFKSIDSPQFKKFMSDNISYLIDSKAIFEEHRKNLPFPEYEPFFVQSGVKFIYQQNEIGPASSGVLQAETSFFEMADLLTDDARSVLQDNNAQ